MVDIVPAILSYSRQDLISKISAVKGFARAIHIDVMDGQFVHNKTVGIADLLNLPYEGQIEFHLMVSDPMKYIQQLPGGANVTYQVHAEAAAGQLSHLAAAARHKGSKLAVVLNPSTQITPIAGELRQFTHVLLMTVVPGIDGQKYMPEVEMKISQLRNMSPGMMIEVDGGINMQTAPRAAAAGASRLAAATAIFGAGDKAAAYRQLHLVANGGSP